MICVCQFCLWGSTRSMFYLNPELSNLISSFWCRPTAPGQVLKAMLRAASRTACGGDLDVQAAADGAAAAALFDTQRCLQRY